MQKRSFNLEYQKDLSEIVIYKCYFKIDRNIYWIDTLETDSMISKTLLK